jgi:hypothetical protein
VVETYRAVVLMSVCPINCASVRASTPLSASTLAKVCRSAYGARRAIPARAHQRSSFRRNTSAL